MLRKAIGVQRFDRITATFKPETVKGMAAYRRHRYLAHPLAVEWHELMQAVDNSEAQGKLALPERSFYLLDQLIRLKGLLGLADIDRILTKLETGREYFSTMFEIYILSCYRDLGALIEIVPESKVPGVRTADFLVKAKGGNCYVECKSLEDMSREEQHFYEEVQEGAMRAMDANTRSWRIEIRATRILRGRDIVDIVKLVTKSIVADDLTPIASSDGGITIKFSRFSSFPEGWITGTQDDIPRSLSMGYIECETGTDLIGNPRYKRVMIVECEPYLSNDESKRILADVNSAHGQIPDGSSGIVHIEIPFKKGDRLLEVSDLAYQRAFGLLKKKRRLNAVILCARTLSKNAKEGENPIQNYEAIVPNSIPATPLPEGIAILGTDFSGMKPPEKTSLWSDIKWFWKQLRLWLKEDVKEWPTSIRKISQLAMLGANAEGTIVIEFGINEPMTSQLGKSLVFFSSPDGAKQLRLWQSFANHFRVDVVHPTFGRRTFRGDLNHLEVGRLHKLAVGWSMEGMSAFVNGEELEPIG
ncbi:hypothetical protein C2U70_16845 [Bradyrhizobium guangdongense]|nr:hypothetical protein C2U70_16845 [Bradyrhizobium guangdongense]